MTCGSPRATSPPRACVPSSQAGEGNARLWTAPLPPGECLSAHTVTEDLPAILRMFHPCGRSLGRSLRRSRRGPSFLFWTRKNVGKVLLPNCAKGFPRRKSTSARTRQPQRRRTEAQRDRGEAMRALTSIIRRWSGDGSDPTGRTFAPHPQRLARFRLAKIRAL
jgi:hypothetical protein